MNPSYPDVFGTYVPASIGKFAGILGYTDLLHEALQEAIDKNQPIEDWDSLGDSLHEASRERRRARK